LFPPPTIFLPLRTYSRARRSNTSTDSASPIAFYSNRTNRTGYTPLFTMVHFTALLAVIAFTSPIALAHPVLRRDASDDTILQNGLESQKLNAAFATLNATDNCTDGDIACVEGALALCRGSSWVTQNCPATLQCFALPDVDQEGVTIGCTSPNTALGLIEATGAEGGINGSDNSTSIDDGSSGNVTTVTVTVTLPADGETQTLSPTTATLTPDQAGSIIGDASPTDTPAATTISLSGPTPDATDSGNSVGTTILLGPSPAADPAATPAPTDGTTIILNAATPAATPAASPAAAAAPPAAPAAGGGYY
jgi:hypothetical protein